MNKNRLSLCSLLVSLFVIVPLTGVSAFAKQSESKIPPNPGVAVNPVIRLSGWSIPGLKQVVAGSRRQSKSVNSSEIQKKKLKLSREPLYELETYYKGDDGSLRIGSSPWVVRNLVACELNGKIFAYQVDLVRVDLSTGVRLYIGIVFTFYFYDEDGDGKFEKRHYAGLETQLSIPAWVNK
jgi:hypothetical protein